MDKPNYDAVYNDDGSENLDKTYERSVLNVRYLYEVKKIPIPMACNQVQEKMHLTYQERERLYKESKEK